MSTQKSSLNEPSRLDLIETNISLLQDDVVGIRNDIKGMKKEISAIRTDMVDLEDRLTTKLDKILDIVSEKQSTVHNRLTKLEHHTTHPPTLAFAA